MSERKVLDLKEVAAQLEVSHETARRWAMNGKLTAVQVAKGCKWRIPIESLPAVRARGA